MSLPRGGSPWAPESAPPARGLHDAGADRGSWFDRDAPARPLTDRRWRTHGGSGCIIKLSQSRQRPDDTVAFRGWVNNHASLLRRVFEYTTEAVNSFFSLVHTLQYWQCSPGPSSTPLTAGLCRALVAYPAAEGYLIQLSSWPQGLVRSISKSRYLSPECELARAQSASYRQCRAASPCRLLLTLPTRIRVTHHVRALDTFGRSNPHLAGIPLPRSLVRLEPVSLAVKASPWLLGSCA